MEEYKSFYKTVSGNEGSLCHYPTRLDTYGKGCSHDCGYCYAKSLLDFRKMWHPENPAVADIGKIRKTVGKIQPGSVVRLGGMTDCFQPIERIHHVTYETITALNERGIGYLIVTKSGLVADDEYMSIYDPDLAHIQVSVTATDDAFLRGIEHASPITERITAIERLQEAGFDVSVRLSPYIWQWVDTDTLNAIRCDKLLIEFLRVNTWIRKWLDIDFSPYTLKHGGYSHLPLDEKLRLLAPLRFQQVTVCDDVPEHYEYFKEHYNANPEDCCNLRPRSLTLE